VTDPPPAKVAPWLFATLLGGGILLRLIRYLWRDSLWGDEAMLATSIVSRSFQGLMRPLDYGQLAPVPFLWLERAAVALGGPNELALRAVPFLASCAFLLALAPFARETLTELETFVALGFAATSSILLRYAAELKPYAVDSLVSLLMLWAALRVARQPERRGPWIALAATVVGGCFVSAPAVFTCAAIAIGLGAGLARQGRPDRALAAVGIAGVGAVVAGAAYVAWYRGAASNPYMRDFWHAGLLRPGTPELLGRTWVGLEETAMPAVEWPVPVYLGWALLALIGLGAARLRRRWGGTPVLLFLLPVAIAFVASAAGRYPIAFRLMLFAVGPLLCLLAAGVVSAAGWVHEKVPSVRQAVLASAMLIPSTEIALRATAVHPRDEEMRPLVAALDARAKPGEPVYVFHRCIPAWAFYTTHWERPDTVRSRWMSAMSGPGGLAHENGATRGPRVAGEGSGLFRGYRGRSELLGVASGISGRHWLGYEPPVPDSGWSANEARRMRTAAVPTIWLVLVNDENRFEGDSLLAAVGRAGGVRQDSVVVPGGRAIRVRFGR
jgi:hypothetical protein